MEKKHIILTTMCTMLLTGTAAAQSSYDLFEEIPLAAQMGEFLPNEHGVLHRHVRLKTDLAQSLFKGGETADHLTFSFIPGRSMTFKNTDSDAKMTSKSKIWSGRAEGPVDGSATLIYRRGGIVGHFQIGTETYRITPGEDDLHIITVLNMTEFPDEGDDMMVPN